MFRQQKAVAQSFFLTDAPNIPMTDKRTVEVFSAGCPACSDIVDMVKEIACDSCEVNVLDMQSDKGARRAEEIGIKTVPSVAVNGRLAACCQHQGVSEQALRREGIGEPL